MWRDSDRLDGGALERGIEAIYLLADRKAHGKIVVMPRLLVCTGEGGTQGPQPRAEAVTVGVRQGLLAL